MATKRYTLEGLPGITIAAMDRNRAYKAQAAFPISFGKIIILTATGFAIWPRPNQRRAEIPFGDFSADIARAVHAMGGLNKRDLEKHVAVCEKAVIAREKHIAATNMIYNAKQLGLPLSARQLRVCEAASGRKSHDGR